jgi:hypothetical protein
VRRSGWLTVVGAAAAGTYVVTRARRQATHELGSSGVPARNGDGSPAPVEPAAEPEPERTPAASGGVTIVPVAMETAVARMPERNGSGPESEPHAPVVEASAPQVVARPPVELPPSKRPDSTTLLGLAGAAGLAAAVLAALALAFALDEGDSSTLPAEDGEALALLAESGSERIPLAGAAGRMVLAVGAGSHAVILLDALEPAPEGKTYEAWVVGPGETTPLPAGLFSASERSVPLRRPVAPGATVGVTIEDAVGADTPSGRFLLAARRP